MTTVVYSLRFDLGDTAIKALEPSGFQGSLFLIFIPLSPPFFPMDGGIEQPPLTHLCYFLWDANCLPTSLWSLTSELTSLSICFFSKRLIKRLNEWIFNTHREYLTGSRHRACSEHHSVSQRLERHELVSFSQGLTFLSWTISWNQLQ